MPVRHPYQDLEPDVWYQLLARAVLFHAVRLRIETLHDRVVHSVAVRNTLDDFYLSAADRAGAVNGNGNGIRTILRDFSTRARDMASHGGTGPVDADLLNDLARLAEEAVTQDPFARMLKRVVRHAAQLYGPCWKPPALSLARTTENPALPPYPLDPYPISGRTSDKPRLTVELVLDVQGFGPGTYAAIPMVLVHECVCHVVARQRGEKSNESTFAEGFMDFAAQYFFHVWIGAIDNELATAAREHGRGVAHRYLASTNPGAHARRTGFRAAESLRGWLESRGGMGLHPASAETTVARLAVEVNRVDARLSVKDHLVARLFLRPYEEPLAADLKSWYEGSTTAENLL